MRRFYVNWNYKLDIYGDMCYATEFSLLGKAIFVDLRICPNEKGNYSAVAVYGDRWGDSLRRLTLKRGTKKEVENYIINLANNRERSAKIINKLYSNVHWKGRFIKSIDEKRNIIYFGRGR